MKTVKVNLYSFNELSDKAREKAILEHQDFLDSQPEEYENEAGELVSEYIEHTEQETIESIEMNDYTFFADGELANCTTFTGKHPRAGETEVKIHGETYKI